MSKIKNKIFELQEKKREIFVKIAQLKKEKDKSDYNIQLRTYHAQKEWVESEIRREKRKSVRNILIPIFFISLFLVVIFLYVFFKPTLTGFAVFEGVSKIYTKQLDIWENNSEEYTIEINESGRINSVKLSGLIEGDGEVKVYFEDKLILYSNNLKVSETKLINKTLDDNQTQEVEVAIKKFSEICEETCDLSEFNFSSGNYKLRIEINGNAKVRIDNLSYGIFREEKIERGKRAEFVELVEGDIISTEIPESWNIKNKNKIKIYWEEGGKEIDFDVGDNDNDGVIDEVSWTSPQGGTQTFEIIVITKAEHLDSNKEFISDIYEDVRELDGKWSEEIPSGDFVRVKFERKLTNTNDITIYPRKISGNPRIEIYEINGTSTIASFDTLKDNEYNKVFLTSLQGEQDSFDLLVLDGAIEIEHIIDPTQLFFENFEAGNLNNWNNVALWNNASDRKDTGTYSAKCTGANDCDMSLATALDTSTASEVNVTFRFNDDDLDGVGDAPYYWNDSSGNWDLIGELDSATEDTWLTFSNSSTDSQYFHKGFNIRFTTTLDGGGGVENLWLDNINVSYTPDTTPPIVTINQPTPPYVNISTSSVDFNVTIDENGDTARYTLDSGANNVTMQKNGQRDFNHTNSSIADGLYTIRFYVNDTAGNLNDTANRTFTVDTTSPTANYVSPTENSGAARNRDYIEVNVTASDSGVGLDSILIRLYNSSQNQINSSTTTSSPNYINFSGLSDGLYFYNATANDTLNNKVDLTTRNITLDRTFPLISYGVGTADDGANLTQSNIYVNVSVTETNFANITFLLRNDTATVNSTTFTTATYEINWTGLPLTNYTYNVSIYDTAGNFNSTATRKINLSEAALNSAPTITFVSIMPATDPSENTIKNILFNFTATDADGGGNINISTAQARFQLTGQTTRSNLTCANITGVFSSNNMNFTCTVGMWYFDYPGAWTVNVTISDNSAANGENSTTTFTYNTLNAMVMSPNALTWASLSAGALNTLSNNDPILINNTGNKNVTNITINAINLIGEQNGAYNIPAANFTVSITDSCDSGTIMGNNSQIQVGSAILPRGNNSLNYGNETSGQEQFYFCLEEVPQSIPSQPYSTSAGGAWTITILATVFAVAGSARRKRKKKIKDDKLVDVLGSIIDEIKEKHSLSKAEILNLVVKELKEKYKISNSEIAEILELKQKDNIPITIFSSKLGGLEALVKYLKENVEMRFSEIAKVLGRDDRTVWTAYKKASEKEKERLKVKETEVLLPISIFKDRRTTVLEAAIMHLKEKGMKYSEIGELLGRDQRNVWAIYSRAVKKLRK
ncbi:Ig-like domain repeat protein [Candidatus Pacearchaeota archaeon]|nr:Ig-like domain repeat protein [Candidatus Pacearchaeota archaeon]